MMNNEHTPDTDKRMDGQTAGIMSDAILEEEAPIEPVELEKVPAWAVAARVILIAVMLGGAGWLAWHWLHTRPTAQRKAHGSVATIVEVREMHPRDYQVAIKAMGVVIPARSVEIASQVAGRIDYVDSDNFLPGGIFHAGDTLAEIEDDDYRLTVSQRQADLLQKQANLATAEAELTQELARRDVARREYEMMGSEMDPKDAELVLRVPQLKIAQAKVDTAKAALESAKSGLAMARLNLTRTKVQAPFNCILSEKYVDIGSQATAGGKLAELVGTDEFWIEMSVPVDQLAWMNIPAGAARTGGDADVASSVLLRNRAAGGDATRKGFIERMAADLDPLGRTARVIASVEDPLLLRGMDNGMFKLILGSYVSCDILGRTIHNAYRLPRESVLEGNRVLIFSPENRLEIRTLTPIWSDQDHLYFAEGLTDGDKAVLSGIAAPVEGMLLADAAEETSPAAPQEKPGDKEKKLGGPADE